MNHTYIHTTDLQLSPQPPSQPCVDVVNELTYRFMHGIEVPSLEDIETYSLDIADIINFVLNCGDNNLLQGWTNILREINIIGLSNLNAGLRELIKPSFILYIEDNKCYVNRHNPMCENAELWGSLGSDVVRCGALFDPLEFYPSRPLPTEAELYFICH